MLKRKKFFALLASAILLTAFVSCGSGGGSSTGDGSSTAAGGDATTPEMVLRYAEAHPDDYPASLAAHRFAELVAEKTNGRIKIEVYTGAQLGDEKSVIEQLQFGGIDFMRSSISTVAEASKELNVLQMPYLYRDEEHMWKVLDGEIGDQFMNGVENSSNLVGLSWYGAGARSIYNSQREIKSLDDMKGLKIRVQEAEVPMAIIKAFGGNPTPMAYGEVYSSLQTGVIDGAENNFPSYESSSHFEVAKFITLNEHTYVPELQLCSKQTFAKFSPEDQALIKEAAQESAIFEREEWIKREELSKQTVIDAGVTITELTAEERQRFVDAVAPLYDEFTSEYKDIVDAIRAIK